MRAGNLLRLFTLFGFFSKQDVIYVCINVCMYHSFRKTGFSSFTYYSYFLSAILLSSNFSPIFYLSLLFALKYLSGNKLQPLFSQALRLREYLVSGSVLLSLSAFYSEIQGAGTRIFSYIRRLGPFLGSKF